ncbi:small RNA 2'-O-methyltransferase-like [Iris pallida]|uniref:Small RNA 2'-O-methyltransferase n=1 Tax=Iris pallida TaxID=29817 RepID=A0AAX6EDT7_IRIPA|nr:small RNA 2'-O-methyltransferase-like [Iris pallida]
MDAQQTTAAAAAAALTPKALIHQKYGTKACYKIEEVQQSVDSTCPGLVTPQQSRCLYRCYLSLPEFTTTSDAFPKKKDAEQSAAKMAIEKLGIQSTSKNLTPQEAWDELATRLSVLFSEEFLSSSHPLVGHFRVSLGRIGDHFGMIPVSAIVSCDVKVNNLCKVINPNSDGDPLLVSSYIRKAAKMSDSVCSTDEGFLIRKSGSYSPNILQKLMNHALCTRCSVQIEAIHIPFRDEAQIDIVTLDFSDDQYYMDEISQKLRSRDTSQILVSRTLGKASSEMKLYFSAPEIPAAPSDCVDVFSKAEQNDHLEPVLNKRASYLSGQRIYGDAILANVGYTRKSSDLFYEDVSYCTYYRMLLSKVPDGHYKLFREAILAAELPAVFTARSNWKGPLPRDLLCTFCRQHWLSEPIFSVKMVDPSESSCKLLEACKSSKLLRLSEEIKKTNGGIGVTIDGDLGKSSTFTCEVKLLSRKQVLILDSLSDATYKKESDAIQNAALKVLTWLKKYFSQLDMSIEKLSSFGLADNIVIYSANFSKEFATLLSICGPEQNYPMRRCGASGSNFLDQPHIKEKGTSLLKIEGPDSGVFPSHGSLTCISYVVTLIRKEEPLKEVIERNDEFEFEVGSGAVINQLEVSATQLSVNQSAQFTIELPSRDLILAAAAESSKRLSHLSLNNCFLEYSIKVLRVTEPLEDRMEQALFSPPLSKQRVEFAVRHINASHSTTLVDFGCGSGSLLDSLFEHSTTLEKIVGVDISCKSLTRAAKLIHSKLSMKSVMEPNIRSAVLYDGSIMDFDSRLYGFGIGTCLEVIEHMEEDQACLFGNVVLSSFCPELLIVSTPNYEYNPILQRSSLPNKEDDPEDKSGPCKFRNHDHKFEWTRQQFEQWSVDLAGRHNYSVEFSGVGGSGDVEPGFASQIAVFRRRSLQLEKKSSTDEEPSHPYKVIWEWNKGS